MAFPVKDWRNDAEGPPETPVTAEALEDMERRLSGYVDGVVSTKHLAVQVDDYGAVGDGVILFNAAMAAGSPVLTDPAAAFVVGDVGKTIIVSGVGPANESLVSTIASRQSATQVTLAAPATVDSPDPANCKIAVYGTDDTAAVQAASDAAALSAIGTLDYGPKVYVLAGALQQGGARKANAQITLPNTATFGRLTWRGARSAAATPLMPFPRFGGGCTILVSTLIGRTYSATYGVPSVVGGPTQEQQSTFAPLAFDIEDVALLTPRNPSLSGFNLENIRAANRRRMSVGTLEWGYPVDAFEGLAVAEPTHPQAAAMIDPRTTNSQGAAGVVEEFSTWGYFAGIVPNEHTVGEAIRVFATKVPIAIRNGAGALISGATHAAMLGYVACEACPRAISGWDPAAASSAAGVVAVPTGKFTLKVALDIEDYADSQLVPDWVVLVNHVNDPTNRLRGTIEFARWSYVAGVFAEQTALVLTGGNLPVYRCLTTAVLIPAVGNIDQAVIDALTPSLIQILPVHNTMLEITGDWRVANVGNTTAMHNAVIFNNAAADGDEIAFDVVLAKGTWNLGILIVKAANEGIFRTYLDGVAFNPTTDCYNAVAAYNVQGEWPFTVTTTGKHRLSFKVEGKNASSTGFFVQFQAIQLRRTA